MSRKLTEEREDSLCRSGYHFTAVSRSFTHRSDIRTIDGTTVIRLGSVIRRTEDNLKVSEGWLGAGLCFPSRR